MWEEVIGSLWMIYLFEQTEEDDPDTVFVAVRCIEKMRVEEGGSAATLTLSTRSSSE
jgi:hypothetical protein